MQGAKEGHYLDRPPSEFPPDLGLEGVVRGHFALLLCRLLSIGGLNLVSHNKHPHLNLKQSQ